MNISLRSYILATILGILPGGLAYSFVGASMADVITAQEAANPGCATVGTCAIETDALVTPTLILAMGGLAFVSVLPVIIRKMRQRQNIH